ncbi:MAG: hypothetical protein FWE67_03630 [Planctomycetaceae bacterium]|nr:hypothetical protein [Planctomycetaceae bacterium]
MKRRNFLSSLAGITAGLSAGLPAVFAETSADTGIQIAQPFNGAVLHRRLKDPVVGVVEDSSGKPVALKIKVSGEAPSDAAVTVNGIVARRNGKAFETEIELRQKMNDIVVQAKSPSNETKETRLKVIWLKNSVPRYRFTIDDTIFCLREIHQSNYKSIFEDYFLGNLRKLHQKYGTKFALNLFYETSEEERIKVKKEYFNLSMFSDKYKSEWRDNADWLRLLFHSKCEFPDSPYMNASPETLIADFVQIEREIKRFAGEETYLPATVIHWGTIKPETYKPLAAHGVTVLSGSFQRSDYVSYQLDALRCAYLVKHKLLLDVDSGIVFSKFALGAVNNVSLDSIVPSLEKTIADPNAAELLDLVTHEQYFWEFYNRYMPDHWERLDRAFAFVTEHGYKPVFINDPPLGLDNV